MKTKIIRGLKKEVLMIELPEGYELAGLTNSAIYYYDNQMNYEDYPLSISVDGKYTLLGKPDEINEEDVKPLVEEISSMYGSYYCTEYKDYITDSISYGYKTALESFFSAIEKEIYWVNPLTNEIHAPDIKEWQEAKEKTFDRNRTLIFVKN